MTTYVTYCTEFADASTGETLAIEWHIDPEGNVDIQDIPPRDFPWEPESCQNPWCEQGLMVWVEGEIEHSKPCPDCDEGYYIDMRLEDAAIDRWEAQQDHREYDNRYDY